MTLAVAWENTTSEWLPLTKVAEELGVTRSAVYLMVTQGRLDGTQRGARWLVRRDEIDRFKAGWQRPPSAGRRTGRRFDRPSGPEEVVSLLRDWGDASADELAEAIGRHPGNVRKYLRLLEVRGQAVRLPTGTWAAQDPVVSVC